MNFRKASIFQRDTEKPEEQNDSGGVLAVWGSPGSGKTTILNSYGLTVLRYTNTQIDYQFREVCLDIEKHLP